MGQTLAVVQNVEEKQWKNEELRRLEEGLPRLKECHLEEASRLYEAKQEGVTAFTQKFSWLRQKKRGEKSWSSRRMWSRVEGGRNKLAR